RELLVAEALRLACQLGPLAARHRLLDLHREAEGFGHAAPYTGAPMAQGGGMDDVATTLLALGAATLGESGGMPMHPRIHAAWPGASLAAPAFAVTCSPGDNLA